MKVFVDARSIATTATGVFPQGGVGRYLYQLLLQYEHLAPELELTLIVRAANRRPILEREGVSEVRCTYPANSWRGLFWMARQIDLRKADLYHSPHNILPFGVPCPAVTTVHDVMWFTHPKLCSRFFLDRITKGPLYRVGIRRALKESAHLLTVSEASRGEIERIAPNVTGRITVTHHGVDPSFRAIPPEQVSSNLPGLVPPGTAFVFTIGAGSPHKNQARAIRAFHRAFADRPEIKLVLVRRFRRVDIELSRLLATPAIRRQIILLPHITEDQLRALYSGARMLFFPSLMEGFGMPILEAMACGTPVLTSNCGAMLEVSASAALQVDPYAVDDIAAGLRRLQDDEALRARLIAAGQRRIQDFSWQRSAERTLAVYRSVIGGR